MSFEKIKTYCPLCGGTTVIEAPDPKSWDDTVICTKCDQDGMVPTGIMVAVNKHDHEDVDSYTMYYLVIGPSDLLGRETVQEILQNGGYATEPWPCTHSYDCCGCGVSMPGVELISETVIDNTCYIVVRKGYSRNY